jgi:hypothetical protein
MISYLIMPHICYLLDNFPRHLSIIFLADSPQEMHDVLSSTFVQYTTEFDEKGEHTQNISTCQWDIGQHNME